MIQAYTWQNFVNLRKGDLTEKKMFMCIVALGVAQVIFVINWGISWKAGGYLTTAGAVSGFFVHFFGFYSIWNRSVSSQMLYGIVLATFSLLYIANIVLSSLTLVLNSELLSSADEVIDGAPVGTLTFVLDGIAGDENTSRFLYAFIIVINIILMFLTWYLCFHVFRLRRMLLEQNKELLNVNSKHNSRKSSLIMDYNIPGFQMFSSTNTNSTTTPSKQPENQKDEKETSSEEEKGENENDNDNDNDNARINTS